MIPSVEEIIEGCTFVSRRLGRTGGVSRLAVEAAVCEARELAKTPADEPAALFFAFARRPRAFPSGWRVLPRLLAGVHCQRAGLRLQADADELDQLRARIVVARVSFEQVKNWFLKHTHRSAGPPEP